MAQISYSTPTAPQTIANQAWNDPWFALGNLLAQAWNKRYNDRGERKLAEAVKDWIPGNGTDAAAQSAILDDMKKSGVAAMPEDKVQELYDTFSRIKAGRYGLDEDAVPMSDYTKLTLPQDTGNAVEDFANRVKTLEGIGASQAASPMERAASSAIQNAERQGTEDALKNLAASQMAQKQAMTPFAADDWKARVQAEGVRQGRPQEQIDAVINRYLPQAQQAEKKYNEMFSDAATLQILQNMPGADASGNPTGNSTLTLAGILDLAKKDPDRAKLLLSQMGKAAAPKKSGSSVDDQFKLYALKEQYDEAHGVGKYKPSASGTGGKSAAGTGGKRASAKDGGIDGALDAKLSTALEDLDAAFNGSSDYQKAALDNVTEILNSEEYQKADFAEKADLNKAIQRQMYALNAVREANAGNSERAAQYAGALDAATLKRYGLDRLFK